MKSSYITRFAGWQRRWLLATATLAGVPVTDHTEHGLLDIQTCDFDALIPDPAKRAAFLLGDEEEFFR